MSRVTRALALELRSATEPLGSCLLARALSCFARLNASAATCLFSAKRAATSLFTQCFEMLASFSTAVPGGGCRSLCSPRFRPCSPPPRCFSAEAALWFSCRVLAPHVMRAACPRVGPRACLCSRRFVGSQCIRHGTISLFSSVHQARDYQFSLVQCIRHDYQFSLIQCTVST